MLLFTVVYGVLALINTCALVYKLRDLVRDPRNRELRLLCLAIATYDAPFVLASPAVYTGIDHVLGIANFATLLVYISVAVCLTAFVALLVSWSSAQDKIRLRHRLLVSYSVVTLAVMTAFFFLGQSHVDGVEHPMDFDVHFEATPYISVFLISYQLLFCVSQAMLGILCWRYARIVSDRPWLARGLRIVTVGSVFGEGYSVPKIVNMVWDQVGPSPMHTFSSVVAPMSASVAAALFSLGFTMPAWGSGYARTRERAAAYRRYQRIYPLWRDVADTLPGLVLFNSPPRTTRWTAGRLWRLAGPQVVEVRDGRVALRPKNDPEVQYTLDDIALLLARQITEIRDAQWQLRQLFTAQTAAVARSLAEDQGLTGEDADAVAEAAQLAIALRARAAGVQVPGEDGSPLIDPGGEGGAGDDDEAAWLMKVADAYRTSPIIPIALSRTFESEWADA
ncbi:MAB_1171c family putative transporter [Streptacidiphilus rugosus]|uniref:MAB_1171c family putative transporter n=1 Tax=Streptacidiphilus rugosus TaxID=405783 RepID=UPI000563F678|nr:MAB_1171c family putative transporter [Streptacidiphilus rugosus]